MTKKIFTTALILTAFAASAQTDTLQGNGLDEVIVTANKYPQKQSTTGKVISVITKDQIEKSSGRTLSQLLNEQAGITVNGALNNLGANQTVYTRGASSGRTLILLDGIPVNDPTLITNDFDLNLVSLTNVERIEIARGAQSTLYGSDAVAGVINIITEKNNIIKPVNVKATAAGGLYGTFRGNVQVYGKEKKLSYNARYARLSSKGFSAAFDSTGKNGFDNDGYNSNVAGASLQYQLSDNLALRTFVQHSRYNTDLDANIFTDEKDNTGKNKSLITGGGVYYKKDKINITANYQYSENNRNYYNDSADQAAFTKFSTDHYFGNAHFAEAYSSIRLSKSLVLLAGADFRLNRMNSNYYSLSAYGPYTSSFNDTSVSQGSLYGSLSYHDATEKVSIELGGRWNKHSRYGSNKTFTFNPSYKISDHFRIFASAASAFKAPTLYQLYSSYGSQDLKPERSETYEAGVQYQLPKVNARLVYFNRNIKDGIEFDNINYKYYNYSRQTVNGAEFETKVEPVKNLIITGNYTYLKPNELSQSRITFKDTTYNHLLRRPQHSTNITIGYRFDNSLYVSASGKYVGSRFDFGDYGTNDVLLNHYVLLSGYVEYSLKNYLKLFLDAQNITNKKFFDVRGYNSIPFLLNAGITFSL